MIFQGSDGFEYSLYDFRAKIENPTYIEIRKDKDHPFGILNILDYLITDKEVYEKIIRDAEKSDDANDRIIALMAMRPYSYIMLKGTNQESVYNDIEEKSTYFHHSLYANSKRIKYDDNKYSSVGLKSYCSLVMSATGLNINIESLVPDNYKYNGLDYDASWILYNAIPTNSMLNLRKKALVFRVLLETSLFMLLTKARFDPEHIGSFYNKATKGQVGEKKKLCEDVYKMYNLSKKYHHGADGASTLGLSALNPDEMLFFDSSIQRIHEWIITHPDECNPNASLYMTRRAENLMS